MASRYYSFNIFMDDVIKRANQRVDLEELFDLDSNDVIKIISLLLTREWWVYIAVATLLILGPFAFAAAIITFMTSPPGLIVAAIFGVGGVATIKQLYQNKELPIAVKEVGEEFKPRWERVEGNESQVDLLLEEAVTSLINKARNAQKKLKKNFWDF